MTDTTPADRPADQLRAAAAKLRALCLAVGDPDYPGQPWHTDQCSDENRGECACIVAQGHTAEGDGPATSLHYIADTEHPDLAAWLDTEAATWAGDEVHNSCSTQSCTLDAALAVARQLLGTSATAVCGTSGACNGGPCPLTAAEPEPDTELRDRIAAAIRAESSRVDDLALADDAAAGVQPPTSEAQPARRRLTPREHDRAWHAIEGSAGEPGADPGTVLAAVLHALRIDAPTAAEEQAASPSRRATPPAAPAAPEETQ
ncbi:hypothetical protein [Streptomyces sp. NPDC059258]|uniref:hypothetical protein n=1 Tax=unclassified Streptomyces TaxID=2593676 RepID=UPI0036A37515